MGGRADLGFSADTNGVLPSNVARITATKVSALWKIVRTTARVLLSIGLILPGHTQSGRFAWNRR